MFDIIAVLCLTTGMEACVERRIPVGGADCDSARAGAEGRLDGWRRAYTVRHVTCTDSPGAALDFVEMRPDVFVHRGEIDVASPDNVGDVANIAFVVGGSAVAMIDSGGSRAVGEAAVAAVRTWTDLPIRYLILTHMHPDHVFGATAVVDAGAEVVGHRALPQALAARADNYLESVGTLVGPAFAGTEPPVIGLTVSHDLTLDLGGRKLSLRAWPVAHTEADLSVVDVASATLIAGDLVFDEHIPALDGSLVGWLAAIDVLAGMPFAAAVPGHGDALLPWPAGVAPQRAYLEALARDVRAAIAAGATLGSAAEAAVPEAAQTWRLSDEFNARNATVAYTELEWE